MHTQCKERGWAGARSALTRNLRPCHSITPPSPPYLVEAGACPVSLDQELAPLPLHYPPLPPHLVEAGARPVSLDQELAPLPLERCGGGGGGALLLLLNLA